MRPATRKPRPPRKEPRRRPGRPADEAIDQALLRAATQEFLARGYHALSMEGIAARAGVSKVSLYRRWKNKADIAGDVFRAMAQEPAAAPPTLESFVRELVGSLRSPEARRRGQQVMRTMGEIAGDRRLLALYRELLLEPRWNQVRSVLEQARRTGELTSTAPTDVLCALIAGPVFLSYLALLAGADLDLGEATEHLLGVLLDALGVARPSGSSPPRARGLVRPGARSRSG